jgi:hypothetical protein
MLSLYKTYFPFIFYFYNFHGLNSFCTFSPDLKSHEIWVFLILFLILFQVFIALFFNFEAKDGLITAPKIFYWIFEILSMLPG